ncbi:MULTISPECIES: hypothetical protein [Rhodobacterales]|uniref:hypothetical protein n=1 Tax=Rhodobacterales TaxID=204455 RepID=UPI0011BD6EDF|nr:MULTISPECIES: hypothetical protein [Rhodobacterales]MDO6588951.1 hypothetical protein [Yoonia sp. 1_MG-2023]
MRILFVLGACCVTFFAGAGIADTRDDLIAIPQVQAACTPYGVANAAYDGQGRIVVTCNEDATAFVPALGGLGPVLSLVASMVVAGNTTPHTH